MVLTVSKFLVSTRFAFSCLHGQKEYVKGCFRPYKVEICRSHY